MKSKLFGLVLLAGLALPAFGQETTAPIPPQTVAPAQHSTAGWHGYNPSADAAKDIAAAVKKAAKEKKRVLVDVGGNWCIWCKKLDEFFETDKEAGDYMRAHYVLVKVNWSEENKNEAVLARYPKVEAFPHLFVLDNKGKLVHSQPTGELENGPGHDHTKVLTFLKKYAM